MAISAPRRPRGGRDRILAGPFAIGQDQDAPAFAGRDQAQGESRGRRSGECSRPTRAVKPLKPAALGRRSTTASRPKATTPRRSRGPIDFWSRSMTSFWAAAAPSGIDSLASATTTTVPARSGSLRRARRWRDDEEERDGAEQAQAAMGQGPGDPGHRQRDQEQQPDRLKEDDHVEPLLPRASRTRWTVMMAKAARPKIHAAEANWRRCPLSSFQAPQRPVAQAREFGFFGGERIDHKGVGGRSHDDRVLPGHRRFQGEAVRGFGELDFVVPSGRVTVDRLAGGPQSTSAPSRALLSTIRVARRPPLEQIPEQDRPIRGVVQRGKFGVEVEREVTTTERVFARQEEWGVAGEDDGHAPWGMARLVEAVQTTPSSARPSASGWVVSMTNGPVNAAPSSAEGNTQRKLPGIGAGRGRSAW
jgi:hypothetical protein